MLWMSSLTQGMLWVYLCLGHAPETVRGNLQVTRPLSVCIRWVEEKEGRCGGFPFCLPLLAFQPDTLLGRRKWLARLMH